MKAKEQQLLLNWFDKNQRPLPWRQHPSPADSAGHFYSTLVSEVMLQQTTSQAVIPYYKKFLQRFATLKALAQAPQSEVLAAWAGLGYYSRAQNLHKAARQLVAQARLPRSYEELILYPGLGPYTARSISSLVYGQRVGVLDGNVIRVLTRKHALPLKWWLPQERKHLQHLADQAVQKVNSGQMNQALMELGATICLPQNPKCVMCPWLRHCQAQKQDLVHKLPLTKAKTPKQMWLWQSTLRLQKGRVQLMQNTKAPFLKNHWLPTAQAQRIYKKPAHYDFCHRITKYKIFVQVKTSTQKLSRCGAHKWGSVKKLSHISPTSFVSKQIRCIKAQKSKL